MKPGLSEMVGGSLAQREHQFGGLGDQFGAGGGVRDDLDARDEWGGVDPVHAEKAIGAGDRFD